VNVLLNSHRYEAAQSCCFRHDPFIVKFLNTNKDKGKPASYFIVGILT